MKLMVPRECGSLVGWRGLRHGCNHAGAAAWTGLGERATHLWRWCLPEPEEYPIPSARSIRAGMGNAVQKRAGDL